MREPLSVVRITAKTKENLYNLSVRKGLKVVTVLEYLLSGKISLSELHENKEEKGVEIILGGLQTEIRPKGIRTEANGEIYL